MHQLLWNVSTSVTATSSPEITIHHQRARCPVPGGGVESLRFWPFRGMTLSRGPSFGEHVGGFTMNQPGKTSGKISIETTRKKNWGRTWSRVYVGCFWKSPWKQEIYKVETATKGGIWPQWPLILGKFTRIWTLPVGSEYGIPWN